METGTRQRRGVIVHCVDGLNQQDKRLRFHRATYFRRTLTLVMSSRRPMARAAAEGECERRTVYCV